MVYESRVTYLRGATSRVKIRDKTNTHTRTLKIYKHIPLTNTCI